MTDHPKREKPDWIEETKQRLEASKIAGEALFAKVKPPREKFKIYRDQAMRCDLISSDAYLEILSALEDAIGERDELRSIIANEWDLYKQMEQERDKALAELADAREINRHRVLEFIGVDPNHACTSCGGIGEKCYSSTSTWGGGIGGQALTNAVCDKCWGSGDAERPWANLREYQQQLASLKSESSSKIEHMSSEIERLKSENERLKQFEFMYKELCK